MIAARHAESVVFPFPLGRASQEKTVEKRLRYSRILKSFSVINASGTKRPRIHVSGQQCVNTIA